MTGACLGRALIIAGGLLLLAGPRLAADESVAGLVAPYLKARGDGTLGTVAAKAYAEPTRPSAGPAPQPSVSVTLVPYSATLEAELDAVKAGLRDSLDGYVQAVARIEGAPWLEGGHFSKRFRLRDTETSRFPNVSSNVTYSTVTYWRTRVTVRTGETAEVTMSDRNVWLTAARQEGGTPVAPRRPQGSKQRR